jgi:anti-sigma regulatory factor (Ser/Thr protein kinase)
MLPPLPTSVPAARRFVRDVLMSRDVPEPVVETVQLLTSEVVTNAIVHAGTGPRLSVSLPDRKVRVAVADQCGGRPVRRFPPPESPTGRGMVIVDELAAAWGVDVGDDGGKQVWFEVPR